MIRKLNELFTTRNNPLLGLTIITISLIIFIGVFPYYLPDATSIELASISIGIVWIIAGLTIATKPDK